MNIIISPNSIEQHSSGNITGEIFFEYEGKFYPEKKLE